jgi:hypothetical protein
MLFLMDACYGGLALSRTTIPPGSMRFLKDMLQRYSRQVLTAGKADEAVSDAGGTRAGHSIFTSHLLDGLEGAAAPGGVLTGHGLMAYVYNKVGGDIHSHQTPHFGFIDGDGDFIFDTAVIAKLESKSDDAPGTDPDIFIKAPLFPTPVSPEAGVPEILKRLIGNPNEKIQLNDYVSDLIRRAAEKLGGENFPPHGEATDEEIALRLKRYEEAVGDVQIAAILLAHWGEPDQLKQLEKIIARLAEVERHNAGSVLWLNLNWYPILLLMYSAGISSLAARRYSALYVALLTRVYGDSRYHRSSQQTPIVLPVIDELTESSNAFKRLPDMERKYVPRSEHIFRKLQPVLEDQLFLGKSYEALFDEFEIFLALSYADIQSDDPKANIWGPPGRFLWKERGRGGDSAVYSKFVARAKSEGSHWAPLEAGFFRGSAERFSEIADAYSAFLQQVKLW